MTRATNIRMAVRATNHTFSVERLLPAFRRQNGFTLLELAAVVLLLAVVTALALSSYVDYARRANITEALRELDRYATRMHKAYQDSGNYGIAACAVNLPAGSTKFDFSCSLSQGNQGFSATAAGVGATQDFSFSIDNYSKHTSAVTR